MDDERKRKVERVSLSGLDPAEALKALLAVKSDAPPSGEHNESKQPPPKPAEPDRAD